jgi:hypothetical protein
VAAFFEHCLRAIPVLQYHPKAFAAGLGLQQLCRISAAFLPQSPAPRSVSSRIAHGTMRKSD